MTIKILHKSLQFIIWDGSSSKTNSNERLLSLCHSNDKHGSMWKTLISYDCKFKSKNHCAKLNSHDQQASYWLRSTLPKNICDDIRQLPWSWAKARLLVDFKVLTPVSWPLSQRDETYGHHSARIGKASHTGCFIALLVHLLHRLFFYLLISCSVKNCELSGWFFLSFFFSRKKITKKCIFHQSVKRISK